MTLPDKKLSVLQVLPALNSGGVERGTVDFARFLVEQGYRSTVMSAGGRMVKRLQGEGSEHIEFPVHKKSLLSFLRVGQLRQRLLELQPDIIHVRSRMPAWLIWQALKRWPLAKPPTLVSTFHGLYSVSFYSAIMGCGDAVIAISNCVRDYIVHNYPKISPANIHVVHRGVDQSQFNPDVVVDRQWRSRLETDFPELTEKTWLLMPGRLSEWKGQLDFIELIDRLVVRDNKIHGLIVGEATPGKENYVDKLKQEVIRRGLSRHISFFGHRDDMEKLYKVSAVVFNLSQHAEPFGRTVIEALAVGTPVVAYDCGGPAESLRECLPQGLVAQGDTTALVEKVEEFIQQRPQFTLPVEFTLQHQAQQTLKIYHDVLSRLKVN